MEQQVRPAKRDRWTPERAAWLGYLIAKGQTPDKIATDPIIRSTPAAVARAANRFQLTLCNRGPWIISLPKQEAAVFDAAGAKRGTSGERIAYLFLCAGADGNGILIDNILDDGA